MSIWVTPPLVGIAATGDHEGDRSHQGIRAPTERGWNHQRCSDGDARSKRDLHAKRVDAWPAWGLHGIAFLAPLLFQFRHRVEGVLKCLEQ